MAPFTRLGSARRFAEAALLERPRLLGVGWAVTERCNSRCPFCSRHGGPDGPPNEVALDVIDQLADVGCRRVHFTGGEPLLRMDLPELLARVRERRMTSSVNTNGALLADCPEVIARADAFLVSVDGPEAIHDRYRGAGSFARLVRGLELLVRERRPRVLSVTLFRENLDQMPFFLALSRRFDARIALQPGASHVLGAERPNPERPDVERYRAAVAAVLDDPRAMSRMWSSREGLRELMRWPEQHRLRTHAGRITARLEIDGRLFPCSRSVHDPSAQPAPNVFELGVREAFRRLPRIDCSGHVCQCAHNVEKNLLYGLSPGPWWTFATRRLGELGRMLG